MKHVVVALLLFATASVSGFQCAAPRRLTNRSHIPLSGPKPFELASSPTSTEADSENESVVSKAQEILDEFHASNLPFRIVVIGNGAILETTSKLGRKYV
jgi:hypothetical protein